MCNSYKFVISDLKLKVPVPACLVPNPHPVLVLSPKSLNIETLLT
jgi:hypothetical protein